MPSLSSLMTPLVVIKTTTVPTGITSLQANGQSCDNFSVSVSTLKIWIKSPPENRNKAPPTRMHI